MPPRGVCRLVRGILAPEWWKLAVRCSLFAVGFALLANGEGRKAKGGETKNPHGRSQVTLFGQL